MHYTADDIFTPQGRLADVSKNPNLDFLMNIFNIPRVFGVSGFGENWTVGKHSFAVALITLYWSKFNKFSVEKRNRLVVHALLHDVHEAVTGDILPMFKSKDVKKQLDTLQKTILSSLRIKADPDLIVDLKIVDLIAFLYEIQQVSPSILHPKKLKLAEMIAIRQKEVLLRYCHEHKISQKKIERFLISLDI